MAFNYYGYNDTPVTVANDYYDEYAPGSLPCEFSASKIITMCSLSRGASDSGLVDSDSDREDMESVVVSSIYDDYPVVLRMRKGAKMHFVLAEGYYIAPGGRDVTIFINDPESDIDYSTVGEYYSHNWYVDSYVTVE